jgi:hypothetical protein
MADEMYDKGWTPAMLKAHFDEMLDVSERHIREKLTDADLRYQQRFQAQTEAVNAAFLAQQTAMQTALSAAEKAVAAALAAADRAVVKAETAADKRFEAGNEIKEAMGRQGQLMATRVELSQQLGSVIDKIEGPSGLEKRFAELTHRVDTAIAETSGSEVARSAGKMQSNWVAQMSVAVGVALLSMLVSVFTLLRGH